MRDPVIVALLTVMAGPLAAQGAPEADPAAVYRQFAAQLARGAFADAARLLYLPVLDERRFEAVRRMRNHTPYEPTLADVTRHDPDMPPAVAEYQLAQMKKHLQDAANPFEHEWAGVKDTTELLRLTPTEAAARWLEARDPRTMMRRAFRSAPSCRGKRFLADSAAAMIRPVLAGSITRGDTAYVLVRQDVGPVEGDYFWEVPPTVVTLRRMEGRWFVWPAWSLGHGAGAFAISCDSVPR